MSLTRNFLSVGGLTLVSRIFGFFRDALMAAVLGISPVSDAFNAAFRFPNLFRRLFAEGAFNTAFVPMFSGALETQGADGAKELASRIMSWLVAAILVEATIIRMRLVPAVIHLLGRSNWWLPSSMARRLPQLHIERPAVTPASPHSGGPA